MQRTTISTFLFISLSAFAAAEVLYVVQEDLAEVLDLDPNEWHMLANLSNPRFYLGAATLSRSVYILSGIMGTNLTGADEDVTFEIYDSVSGNFSSGPKMRTARYNTGIAAVAGKIYAIGGTGIDGASLNSVEAFDPRTKKWSQVSRMIEKRSYLAVGVLGGQLYAVGGAGLPNSSIVRSIERYDPKADHWSVIKPMNISRAAHCVAVIGERLYAIGGMASARDFLSSVEVYDRKSATWSRVADMQTGRALAGAVALKGRIYVVGGSNASGVVDTIEVYDPKNDTWTLFETRLENPRSSVVAVLEQPRSGCDRIVGIRNVFAAVVFFNAKRLRS